MYSWDRSHDYIGSKIAFVSSNNKRKQLKNWESQRGQNTGWLDVNIVTDCQEQFRTKIKEQRAAWKIDFMYAERKKTGWNIWLFHHGKVTTECFFCFFWCWQQCKSSLDTRANLSRAESGAAHLKMAWVSQIVGLVYIRLSVSAFHLSQHVCIVL